MMNNVTYNVSFPGLGIDLKINPIAFQCPGIKIYWYGIIISIGFLLAYSYIESRKKDFGFNSNDISNFTIIPSFIAIICARIYYIIFYPGDFYLKNPSEIFKISHGGIAIYGAIIGGILSLVTISKVKKKNILSVLDLMSLGVIIGQCIGRWGNFVNQEAFGSETSLPWGMCSENTGFKTVHPCFLYESLGCLICFLILHFISKKKDLPKGNIFALYLLLYSLLRAIIEFFRTDSLLIPGTSLKVSFVLSLLLSASSLSYILIKKLKSTAL